MLAFHSESILVAGDTDRGDVFLRDTRTATTTKVSVTLDGGPVDGIVGYDPASATALMSHILSYAAAAKK